MKLSIPTYAEVLEALRTAADSRGSDKRQFSRVDINVRLQLAILTRDEKPTVEREFTGMTKDISLGGLGLIQSVPIESGRRFVAVLPRLREQPVCIVCQSVFCRVLAEAFYNIGGIFLSEADAELIAAVKALQKKPTAPAAPPLKKAG
jgi:hypothetical protein